MLRFFAFNARVARLRLIAGLLVSVVPAWVAVLLLRTGGRSAMIAAGAIGGATVAKLLTESVRRRHDMGAGGGAAVALLLGSFVAMSVASVAALGPGAFFLPPLVLAGVAIAWGALLLRPAATTESRHAPPIRHPLLPAFGAGRRGAAGIATAAALTATGAGLGLAASVWVDGLRRQHDEIQRNLAADPHVARDDAAADALEQAYNKQEGR